MFDTRLSGGTFFQCVYLQTLVVGLRLWDMFTCEALIDKCAAAVAYYQNQEARAYQMSNKTYQGNPPKDLFVPIERISIRMVVCKDTFACMLICMFRICVCVFVASTL